MKIKRTFPLFNKIYGGSTYWSLSHLTIEKIIKFLTKNRRFLDRFDHTHCAEEIFFQTLVYNLGIPFENNSLRFMKWQDNAQSPDVLTSSDYDSIVNSNAFFARKIDPIKSKTLIEKLKLSE